MLRCWLGVASALVACTTPAGSSPGPPLPPTHLACPVGTSPHTVHPVCIGDGGGTRIEDGAEVEDEPAPDCRRRLLVCGRQIEAAVGWTADVCRRAGGTGDGPVLIHDGRGRRRERGACAGGRADGVWTTWYAGGARASETTYRLGVRHGRYRTWHANGRPRLDADMRDGMPSPHGHR